MTLRPAAPAPRRPRRRLAARPLPAAAGRAAAGRGRRAGAAAGASRRTACGGSRRSAVALLAAAVHRRRLRAGVGLGLLAGLVLFVPAAGLDQPARRLAAVAAAVRRRRPPTSACSAWPPPGCRPLVDRWRCAVAAADRAALGRAGGAARPGARSAGSRGAGWRSARATRRCCGWPRSAARRWSRSRSRPPAGCWSPLPGGAAPPGDACCLAAARLSWRPVGAAGGRAGAGRCRSAGAPGGAGRCTVAIVQGNVPRLGLDFNAQRRAVLDNHVDATLALAAGSPPAQAPSPTWWCGRRTPATSTRCATPTPPPRSPRRPTRSARRSWSARCCAAPAPNEVRNAGAAVAARSPGPTWTRCTSSGTRCRSPSTCRCAPVARLVTRQGRPGPVRLRRRRHARACCAPGRSRSAT